MRRPALHLRGVADLDAPARDGGRRVAAHGLGEPVVDARGRDAAVPDLGRLHHCLHQPIHALAREPRERHHRDAAHLRQQARAILAQRLEQARLVGHEVPFVEADDERPPLALHEVDDGQVLLLERDRGVEEHHHHLGEAHGAQAIGDRELLQLVVDAGAAAHAGGVVQLDPTAAPFPVEGDRIAGDAGLGPDEQAVLAEHAVDERRLAGIRPPDDGNAQGAPLGAALLVLRVGIGLRECGLQGLVQLAQALAVLRGERDRIAEPQREGLVGAGDGAALRLVGDEDDGHARAPHQLGEGLVGRQHAGAGVDHEQHHVGGEDRRLGLHAHAAGQRVVVGLLQSRRVDDAEGETAELHVALAPVARDAGPVVDEGELAPDEPVEQGRLADVRPADDGDGRQIHDVSRMRVWSARRPVRPGRARRARNRFLTPSRAGTLKKSTA